MPVLGSCAKTANQVKKKNMKLAIIIFLVFTVFADFSQTIHDDFESIATCDDQSICQNSDLHESSSEHHHDNNHCDACGCHPGHVHAAVLVQVISTLINQQNIQSITYPVYSNHFISNFQSELIRPPIA